MNAAALFRVLISFVGFLLSWEAEEEGEGE